MNNFAVGYISSSPFWYGTYLPQRIQNIVVRDYCSQNDLKFMWSLPEVSSPDLLFSFNDLLHKSSCSHFRHVIAITNHDNNVWENVFNLAAIKEPTLHFAVENVAIDLNNVSSTRDKLFEKFATKLTLSSRYH